MKRACNSFFLMVLLAWPAAAQDSTGVAVVALLSDPPVAYLKIGESDTVLVTPADTALVPGPYRIEAALDGYEPLVHEVEFGAGDTLSVTFILRRMRPPPPTVADLGETYQPVIPLIPEAEAQRIRRRYQTLAEIFAIVPLAQGIMARIALSGDEDNFSGILIGAGVGLSAGSWLLGRVMGSRKLSEIQAENEGREARNMEADTYNKRLELRLRRQQALEIRTWKQESESRGYVEVRQGRGPVTPSPVEPTESPPDTTRAAD